MKKLLQAALGLSALLLAPMKASAQITFSFTGVAKNTAHGYTMGDLVPFVFVSNFVDQPGSVTQVDSRLSWSVTGNSPPANGAADLPWTSVSVGGLTGSFAPPVSYGGYVDIDDENITTPGFNLFAGGDGGTSSESGLFSIATDKAVHSVFANFTGLGFAPYTSTPNFLEYFTSYAGTHSLDSDKNPFYEAGIIFAGPNGSDAVFFDVNNLTISGPIPEPSTYAAVTGGVAFGWVAWRRRQRPATVQSV